jgi:hypothetical protein
VRRGKVTRDHQQLAVPRAVFVCGEFHGLSFRGVGWVALGCDLSG